jgi:hypothetical protein
VTRRLSDVFEKLRFDEEVTEFGPLMADVRLHYSERIAAGLYSGPDEFSLFPHIHLR